MINSDILKTPKIFEKKTPPTLFRHYLVSNIKKQDSKELSPRSLDKMLLKLQINSQNVQSTQLSKFFKLSKSSKFSLTNMSKLVQIQYDMNCYDSYDSQTCLNMFKHV